MSEDAAKSQRLKKFVREQVRAALLKCGRQMVISKGAEFLTARKLSEASNTSVGTIYNTFATMEDFVAEENMQTLDELYAVLKIIVPEANPYININRYADVFSSFVCNNRNLWMLLYNERMHSENLTYKKQYERKICRIEVLLAAQIKAMFGTLSKAERQTSLQVLEMALFAVSGFLAADPSGSFRGVNKNNICKLLLNTYLAGLASLKR